MSTQAENPQHTRNRIFDAVSTLRCVATLGLCVALITATLNAAPPQIDRSARPHWEPAHFLLNAFLVPALTQDEAPLRWLDPRAQLHCGPDSTVQVNGKPLVAGTAVPVQPFEIAWNADNCRPFGFIGPRFDGAVTLQVYREDWGFSATIIPVGLRYTWPDGETVHVEPRSVSMPQAPWADDPD